MRLFSLPAPRAISLASLCGFAGRWARARRTGCSRIELAGLDAAALRDLGVSRSDLMSMASCAGHGDGSWRAR